MADSSTQSTQATAIVLPRHRRRQSFGPAQVASGRGKERRIIEASKINSNTNTWIEPLREIAARLEEDWIGIRRHLHQHPELSGVEKQTTDFLVKQVESLDLPARVAGEERRGLTVDLVTAPEASSRQRIAVRGDIDALPIEDHKPVDYRSLQSGVMHACGHDVHATIVLATLQLLMEMHRAGNLPWPIAMRAVFQPAEETALGARHMIHHHALQNVSEILALHVDPTRSVGRIGLRAGNLTAACDLIEVKFEGRGGHGARPHLAIDPVDASTRWVQTIYQRLARAIDPHRTVVMTVGQIEAGFSPNVIPDTASLRGTLRSLDPESRRVALETLEAVSKGIELETGCDVEMHLGTSTPAVVNDGRLVRLLSDSATMAVDPAAPEPIEFPSMGSEDFSFYLEHVPGAMFRLGVAGPQVGHEPLHSSKFDIDERAIAIGARIFAAAVINRFAPTNAAEHQRPAGRSRHALSPAASNPSLHQDH